MKKLEGHIAEVMKGIINDEPETTVTEDVEADPELRQKLLQVKKDILDGKTYTTEEVIEMIDQGEV
ncbi:hypothetical protein ACUL41_06225 [Virgibacillus natechei]